MEAESQINNNVGMINRPVQSPPLPPPHHSNHLPCPRCNSLDTKFCYFNNHHIGQPRYRCRSCKRNWTLGGALRDIPEGGRRRSNKKGKKDSLSPFINLSSSSSPNYFLASSMAADTNNSQAPFFMENGNADLVPDDHNNNALRIEDYGFNSVNPTYETDVILLLNNMDPLINPMMQQSAFYGNLAPQINASQFNAPQFNPQQFIAPQFNAPRFNAPRFNAQRFTEPRFNGQGMNINVRPAGQVVQDSDSVLMSNMSLISEKLGVAQMGQSGQEECKMGGITYTFTDPIIATTKGHQY